VIRGVGNYSGAWIWSMNFESRKCEFKLADVIVVIFCINHEYMMLNDHFKSLQGDVDVLLKSA